MLLVVAAAAGVAVSRAIAANCCRIERVHAFTKQYGVEYTYLIAGAPAEMWERCRTRSI
jgi:hypothetical protein